MIKIISKIKSANLIMLFVGWEAIVACQSLQELLFDLTTKKVLVLIGCHLPR